MNSRRMLLVMALISALSVVAVFWLLSVTRYEQAKELEQSQALDTAIETADKELVEKRAELERLRAQVGEKEAREERIQQLVLQGEQALVKQDWSGAETAFLNALREAPKLQAALEGWIKTQINKSAKPDVTVESSEFSEANRDKPRTATILVKIAGATSTEVADRLTEFSDELKKVLESGDLNQKPVPPPHSRLREFMAVRFGIPKTESAAASEAPLPLEYSIKIDFETSAPSVSERHPVER